LYFRQETVITMTDKAMKKILYFKMLLIFIRFKLFRLTYIQIYNLFLIAVCKNKNYQALVLPAIK